MGIPPWLWEVISNSVYGMLALDALWGTYCILMVFSRLGQKGFRNDKQQDAFMDELEKPLLQGDLQTAQMLCEADRRAVPQLALLGLANIGHDIAKVQDLLMERFQQDILSDIENKISWINNVIKTAPMLGLLGTVLGMMAAFGKLASARNIEPSQLANDIAFALITTAIGLFITIPCTLAIAKIGISLKNFENMVTVGLNRFLEGFAVAQKAVASQRR
jgi:biopolymer transport protein ExbB/TolQ